MLWKLLTVGILTLSVRYLLKKFRTWADNKIDELFD